MSQVCIGRLPRLTWTHNFHKLLDVRAPQEYRPQPSPQHLDATPVTILSLFQPLNNFFTFRTGVVLIGKPLGHIHFPIEWQQSTLCYIQDPIREQQVVRAFVPILKHQCNLELEKQIINEIHCVSLRQRSCFDLLQLLAYTPLHISFPQGRPKSWMPTTI